MYSNKQLFEKQANQYNPFFPVVRLEDIMETISDKSIQWILNNYNHIYVEYSESVAITRNKVPSILRHNGLWLSYNNGKEVITEFFNGNNKDINHYASWTDNVNWIRFEYLKDGSITYQHLSDALKELIQSDVTNITNFPDDEDLTTDAGVLKFKNRDYNPNNFTGFGKIILRKNIRTTDGQPKNILSQDMFTQTDTIYEVRYDFDLGGGEITIPENSILDFIGGSLSNGTLILKNNVVINGNNSTFNNISTTGSNISRVSINKLNIINGVISIGKNSSLSTNKDISIKDVNVTITNNIQYPVYLCDIENCIVNNIKIYRENISGYNFSICRCKNFTLDNFVFKGHMRFAINVFIPMENIYAENIKFLNGVIENTNTADEMKGGDQGIYAHEFKKLIIDNVTVSGFTYGDSYDLKIRDGEDVIVNNCTFNHMLIAGYDNNPEWSYNGIDQIRVSNCNGNISYLKTNPITNSYVTNHIGNISDQKYTTNISGFIKGDIICGNIQNAFVQGNVNTSSTTLYHGVNIINSIITGDIYAYNANCTISNSIINSLRVDGTASLHGTHLTNVICKGSNYINLYGSRNPQVVYDNVSMQSFNIGGSNVSYNKITWKNNIVIGNEVYMVTAPTTSRSQKITGSIGIDANTNKIVWFNGSAWLDAMGNAI